MVPLHVATLALKRELLISEILHVPMVPLHVATLTVKRELLIIEITSACSNGSTTCGHTST